MERQIDHLEVHPFYGRQAAEARGFYRLAAKLIPFHTLVPLMAELRLAWVRFKSRRGAAEFADIKDPLINIGCAGRGVPGWINIDAFPSPGVQGLFDCRRRLPFSDNTARGLYTEHFFEHIDYTEEVPHFLSECRRVLKTGGVLRIVVPDAEKYIRAYCDSGWDAISQVRQLGDDQYDKFAGCRYNTKMELLNEVFRQAYEHKFAYDFETLEFLLLKYGFSRVIQQAYDCSLLGELRIDQERRESESLYVEAVK